MHVAAKNGATDLITLLRKYKPNLDVQTVGGNTPLFFAVRFGRFEAAQQLIQYGAFTHLTDKVSG